MLPRGWDRRTTVLLTFALLFVIARNLAQAQVFDLDRDRVPMAELNGLMRFHTGDDPRWADPTFDDSQWPLIRSDRDWGQQGYQGYDGVAWYRFRVTLPRERRRLAIYLPNVWSSYQVFAQGRLVGQIGGLPPHEEVFSGARQCFLLPSLDPDLDTPLVVAVRVWHPAKLARELGGGLWGIPRIGDADALMEWRDLKVKERVWNLSATTQQAVLELLAGAAAMMLFLLRRKEWEYFWFAAYEFFSGFESCVSNYGIFNSLPARTLQLVDIATGTIAALCFLGFVVKILGSRMRVVFWTALSLDLLFVSLTASQLDVATSRGFQVFSLMVYLMTQIPPIILIIQGSRANRRDAHLLLLSVGLLTVVFELVGVGSLMALFGQPTFLNLINWTNTLIHWPIPISLKDICNTSVDLSLLAILILRFARSRRDEERFKTELEAARTVQQVLIPEEIPAIPGLALECVYKPAGQVGGDFFQIIPVASPEFTRLAPELPHASSPALTSIASPVLTHTASPELIRIASPEGAGAFRPLTSASNREGFSPGHSDSAPTSALIVIGDVSGKGMPAAMAVSLLVGTVRTLAHYTQSPGEILTAMNQRMLARSKHGFTTCLVLRLDPDGTATVANAGHLAPYNGSAEVPVESGLPLGLAAEVDYTETTFQLDPGAELTLLTDGVAEARAKTGELFGFERTASIAILSALHIAATAQAFGQQDDITVLKIRRQPIPESAPASVPSPTLSPSPA